MSEYLEIRILNWEKYQGRAKDYKTMPWFRLQSNIIFSDVYERLSASEFKFFVFILSWAALNSHESGQISLNFCSICSKSGVRKVRVRSALGHLATMGVLEYQIHSPVSRTQHVRSETNERTLRTNGTDGDFKVKFLGEGTEPEKDGSLSLGGKTFYQAICDRNVAKFQKPGGQNEN